MWRNFGGKHNFSRLFDFLGATRPARKRSAFHSPLAKIEALDNRLCLSAVMEACGGDDGTSPNVILFTDGNESGSLANHPVPSTTAASATPRGSPATFQATYTRQAPPLVLNSGELLTIGNLTEVTGGRLIVSLTTNGQKKDLLGVFSQGEGAGQVSVSRSNVFYEGTLVGEITGGRKGVPLTITFNQDATFEAAESVAQQVTFSASKKGSTAPRTVSLEWHTTEDAAFDLSGVQVHIESLGQRTQYPPVFGGSGGVSDDDTGGLDDATRAIADQLTSAFENSTLELQYDYIENIQDGRGYTAGRAGFTTATGDFLEVVQRFTEVVPNNPLAAYLPRLEELANAESDSVAGLDGIVDAWLAASSDPLHGDQFRQAQDDVVDELYYRPAVAHWRALGLTSNLSLAALSDAIIQHGEGEDPDSLGAMVDRASAHAGGTPADGVNESLWLNTFLEVRRETLAFATDTATRDGWAESVERVDVYRDLLLLSNMDLTAPITFHVYGDEFTIS